MLKSVATLAISIGALLHHGAMAADPAPLVLRCAFNVSHGGLQGCGQIISYSIPEKVVVATVNNEKSGSGVQILDLSDDGILSERGVVWLGDEFGQETTVGSASSVAADHEGRGFAAVTLIPSDNGRVRGKVAFVDVRAGIANERRVLAVLDVGYHPDSLCFANDGKRLYVANEGEFTSGGDGDAPGSVSIIDLSSVDSLEDLRALGQSEVAEIGFSSHELSSQVDLRRVRINDNSLAALEHRERHIEPESMSEFGDYLYVGLQENNAIGVLHVDREDLSKSKWKNIHDLGYITNAIDASDCDSAEGTGAAIIDDHVKGMPMPDGIGAIACQGRTLLVTANEGDYRPDDGDRVRVKELISGSESPSVSDLHRLRVSSIDSDPDDDGIIDEIVMAGTRSISIWDGDSGELIADTASLESLLLKLDPTLHNIEDGNELAFDERSAEKGPEPEGLAVAEINKRIYAAASMERQNGIVIFDVTDPMHLTCAAYGNSYRSGLIAPESLVIIPAEHSPTHTNLLLAGYEGGFGGIGVYDFDLSSAVIER